MGRHRAARVGAGVGFVGGVVLGLIVWSGQTRRAHRELFSKRWLRRLAALGHLRGQHSLTNVYLLRDYVAWERNPGLRRRGALILRRMEQVLGE